MHTYMLPDGHYKAVSTVYYYARPVYKSTRPAVYKVEISVHERSLTSVKG